MSKRFYTTVLTLGACVLLPYSLQIPPEVYQTTKGPSVSEEYFPASKQNSSERILRMQVDTSNDRPLGETSCDQETIQNKMGCGGFRQPKPERCPDFMELVVENTR